VVVRMIFRGVVQGNMAGLIVRRTVEVTVGEGSSLRRDVSPAPNLHLLFLHLFVLRVVMW
jgi:hypothetical protein